MNRKASLLCICMLVTAMFSACSNETTDPGSSTDAATEAATEATVSKNLYYVNDNGTVDPAQLGSFRAQMEADGYTWTEITLAEIPDDADAIIYNAPAEDLTKEEMDALDAYMDAGGHILLMMPAYEEEIRFKYLSQFLEPYCIAFDYDRISETDEGHMANGDAYHVQANYVSAPDNMAVQVSDTDTFYLRNARSFYFVYQDHFSVVKQDIMLKTAATVIGEPFGGEEDDPLTYEETALDVMGYARYEERANSSIVFVGASDFLEDENYSSDTSANMISIVRSALDWFVLY